MAVTFEILQWVGIVLLVAISGLFAGLTLGIMSLDITGLEIIIASGSPTESKYAKKIFPIRQRGNLLLCTLLLGNVAVNALLSILMADLTSGFVGFILSTSIIVVFGEIVPQAACSRYGLAVGAHTTWIVYLFIYIFFPFAYPISKTLDLILGNEMGTIYSRQQLKKLLDIHSAHQGESGVSRSDVTMLTGVLDFAQKKVAQVMTPMDKVFSIEIDSVLDYGTITTILENGHSRIPVYEKTKTNLIGCLYVKDLALLNPADKVPLRTILGLYKRQLIKTWHDTSLEQMLTEFKTGKSHMAIVHRVNNEGEGDPFYENLGIVCLEDVIEEILQDEILDENDMYHDSRKRNQQHSFDYKTIGSFHGPKTAISKLSPPQIRAIYSYLSGSIDEFTSKHISEDAFIKLLTFKGVSVSDIDKPANGDKYIYTKGIKDDSFVMVLQGRVEIKSGNEGFVSEGGPFTTLGVGALREDSFIPDFSARVASPHVQILRISRLAYEMGVAATHDEYNAFVFNKNRVDNTGAGGVVNTTTINTPNSIVGHSSSSSSSNSHPHPSSPSLIDKPTVVTSPSINTSVNGHTRSNSSNSSSGNNINPKSSSGNINTKTSPSVTTTTTTKGPIESDSDSDDDDSAKPILYAPKHNSNNKDLL